MANITNSLPARPAVKIVVDGLFILCVDDANNTAQLGVYEHTNDHSFFIRVCEKSYSASSNAIGRGGNLIRKLDDQDEIETGDISISVLNRPSGIARYHNASLTESVFATDPTDTSSGVVQNPGAYEPDFRWIINLEGARFHNKKLDLIPGIIERKVTLTHGILHTHKFVGRQIAWAYEKAAKLAGAADLTQLYFVTAQMGISIESLASNESLEIACGEGSGRKTITLQPPAVDSYYEIYLNNNCPAHIAQNKMRQSDFQHYYNAINVPPAERLEEKPLYGTGSNSFPCDLIYLEQTPSLP